MARGSGKKSVSANGPSKTAREFGRITRSRAIRSRSPLELSSVENNIDALERENPIHLKSHDVTVGTRVVLLNDKSNERTILCNEVQHSECGISVICQTSTCILTEKISHVLDSQKEGNISTVMSQGNKKYDIQSPAQTGTRISVSNEQASDYDRDKHTMKTELPPTTTDVSNERFSYVFELVVHLNTLLYWMFSLSTEHLLKVASHDRKPSVVVEPFTLKILFTLSLGIVADFTSPVAALVIPQVFCLITGILLSLQTPSELLAYIASYLPHINSGLIGTQLLLLLHLKSRESYAAALSRIGGVYCLMDLFSLSLLRVAKGYFGHTLSYQIMTFSSFMGLVGVLYLFHTNQSKDPSHHCQHSFFKMVFMKLMITIPVALFLPQFQNLLNTGGHGSRYSLAVLVISRLVFEQCMMVPSVQVFSTSMKTLSASAVALTLLYASMIFVETASSNLLLLILVYSVVGIVQNIIVSFLMTSYSGLPGLMLAVNLILHIVIRHLTAQVTKDVTAIYSYMDRECSNFSVWYKDFINDRSLLKTISYSFLDNDIFICDNVYMNVVSMICSICSAFLVLFAR